jgi:siroheme synthase (precorrin-2 oxidase/ferrochelatase)
MEPILEQIHEDLQSMKKEIEDIKAYMIDLDSIMTHDDFKALEKYKKEKEEGKLTSHVKLKKELGL